MPTKCVDRVWGGGSLPHINGVSLGTVHSGAPHNFMLDFDARVGFAYGELSQRTAADISTLAWLLYVLPCFVAISIVIFVLWKVWPLYTRLTSGANHIKKVLATMGMSREKVSQVIQLLSRTTLTTMSPDDHIGPCIGYH